MKILMKEIKASLIGKGISYFNSFNGNYTYFTIVSIKNENQSICVYAKKEDSKERRILIKKEYIASLIQSGIYENEYTIEYCSCKEVWKLYNE